MVTELEEFGDRVELVGEIPKRGAIPRRALRRDELRGIRVQGGASWPARPKKKM